MKRYLTELNKLEEYLKSRGVPYVRIDNDDVYGNTGKIPDEFVSDWHQIVVPNKTEQRWDAICHYGSYGCEQGLLEVMGTIVAARPNGDSVIGYLTAEDVISMIEEVEGCVPG